MAPSCIPRPTPVRAAALGMLRDIATDAKWQPLSDPDMMIVHVIAPKAEEVVASAEVAAAPTAAAEPEVIKKGKKDEEADEKKDEKKK